MKDSLLSITNLWRMSDPVNVVQKVPIPKLISFSGVDGAGKSTQIEALCAEMGEAGVRFRVVRFWDEIASLVRFREAASIGVFRSEVGVGAPGAPVNRRDKNVRSWFLTWVRLSLYALDAYSLRALIRKAPHWDCDVIVFDRYIYDELANLNLDNPVVRIYIRIILVLVPRPDLSLLLDANPAEARARKPEYPLEFLHVNREAYLSLSNLIGGVTVIDPMPVEEVKREIIKRGAELFPGKDRQYVT